MNRIIYKNQDNTVIVLIPAQDVLDTVGLLAIAEKDVPAPYKYPTVWQTVINEDSGEEEDSVVEWAEYGTPYWLALDTDIPADRADRNAWRIDNALGDPDGFGGESNEFTNAQIFELYKAGVIANEPI